MRSGRTVLGLKTLLLLPVRLSSTCRVIAELVEVRLENAGGLDKGGKYLKRSGTVPDFGWHGATGTLELLAEPFPPRPWRSRCFDVHRKEARAAMGRREDKVA